jgi:hypothetical protein
MNQSATSTQITSILKAISLGDGAKISAELESYIAELEAKQPHRPAHITAILSTIRSQYPADMEVSLETYISNLEEKQQAIVPSANHSSSWDPNNPPRWSHQ